MCSETENSRSTVALLEGAALVRMTARLVPSGDIVVGTGLLKPDGDMVGCYVSERDGRFRVTDCGELANALDDREPAIRDWLLKTYEMTTDPETLETRSAWVPLNELVSAIARFCSLALIADAP